MPTRSRRLPLILIAAATVACSHPAADGPAPEALVQLQTSGTTALLQAVSAANDRVVWVSGHSATFARTVDGGVTWQAGRVPGDTSLQFRDVYALDENTAWLMSAGNGPASRIYHTTDGGKTWALQFTNTDPKAFYDCMDFWDARRGIAVSDEVGGHVILLSTTDGGVHWTQPDPLPVAQPNEGGFAASGTCLVTRPGGHVWIGTGNSARSRLLHSVNYGASWTVDSTPLPSGDGVGIMSVSFRDLRNGIVMGGNAGNNNVRADVAASTHDGGRSWTVGGRPAFSGAIFGGAYVPGARKPTVVAVGPKGSAYSRDDGATWIALDSAAYWAVGFSAHGTGWAVGPRGRIVRLSGF